MEIICNFNLLEFLENKKFSSIYSPHQIEALYELLSDKHLGKHLIKKFKEENLISVEIRERELVGVWKGYKEKDLLINLF